ncbi:HAD family phosphatase [Bacillus sp. FJAT-42376]|uniref:Cof-type HAD-IIB family hydrolase n=1 Tax=Bacillus sp. FJAT-42376 TaxID=2014076 RepID=UPI000F4EDA04|nr:Cof-type HAD-IIB family hydrolase [Bacillus sp. FJAT-42376]AZB42207.1 HAD family phosphatase [Bacillus sp. FJAT-42376]
MVYRMLALNIDGTLLRSNGRLHQATREAIEFVQKKGVYVTLVTNRHFQSARKLARALKLESILVTHSGAFISEKIDEPLFERRLGEEMTYTLVQVLENYECHIRIIHERYSIGNRVKVTPHMTGSTVIQSSEPLFYPNQYVESLGDALRDEPIDAPKIEVLFQSKSEKQAAENFLNETFQEVTLSTRNPLRFDLTAKGVSKATGLGLLCSHLQIPMSEVVAIGDSADDRDMIAHAGLGVAMGQAPFEVKQAADWITRSNEDSGVAYMIKEHFRKQYRLGYIDKIKLDR